jgi:hypothetical protein
MNFCATISSSRQGMCVLLMAAACTSNPFFCAHNPHVEAHSLLLICILLRYWSWSYFVIGILKLYNHRTILSCCSCKFWVFLELTWTGLVVPSKFVPLWWSFFLCNSREIFVRQILPLLVVFPCVQLFLVWPGSPELCLSHNINVDLSH